MDVQSIDHVYVETHDFERTLAFWQGLGFRLAESWGGDGHRAGRLVAGDAVVVLATAHGGEAAGPTVHLRVPDTRAAQSGLDGSADVSVTLREQATHWGTRWIRVRDPDGNDWVLEQTPDAS